jgi:hypothetical protein
VSPAVSAAPLRSPSPQVPATASAGAKDVKTWSVNVCSFIRIALSFLVTPFSGNRQEEEEEKGYFAGRQRRHILHVRVR